MVNGQVLCDFSHVGGESFVAFGRRVLPGFADLLSAHRPDDVVAVFTHGGVKNVLVDHCAGRELSPTLRTLFGNCSISTVDAVEARFTIHTINDVTHLA
jgi:broad specificity phosphatase PhoE